MAIYGKEILGIVSAQTLFHYTERYRYTTTITQYKVRGYMVVNRVNPVYIGTVYKTAEDATNGMKNLQDWLRRECKYRTADELMVVPYDTIETVSKKRAYKLG